MLSYFIYISGISLVALISATSSTFSDTYSICFSILTAGTIISEAIKSNNRKK